MRSSPFTWVPIRVKQLLIGFMVFLGGMPVFASAFAEELKARPYRPTVSNPAYLPVPQYLEVEIGWQSLKAKSDDRHRHSLPYLLKYAFTEQIGVLIRGDAGIVKDRPTQSGFGDILGLFKLVHPLKTSMPSALSLEGGIKFPTAPKTVGTGHTNYELNGIYSIALGRLAFDLNFLYTRLGGAPGE